MTTTDLSPAVWYARIFGIVLTLVGILGFVLTDGVTQDHTELLFGLEVNTFHNIVHLLTGVLGLAAGFALLAYARMYALVLGVVYLVVGLWGMVDSNPLGLFAEINTADNILHLVIGVAGLAAWAMSKNAVHTTDENIV